jgi:1-acyl-sn-glycerol-3-phosphate acyltransferase
MPWLLPVFPAVARAAAFVYYRIRYAGPPVPGTGPALLVANHPNSLLDPMLVVAAARRPVRFLAKAPLFRDVKTAWMVRAAGAIPVYRRSDDPAETVRNVDAFDAVYAELARGAAVGIFPEGLSHSEPALAPLKTGAARMALGAAALTGGPFPVVPVGLVFHRKDEFRSRAYVVTGPPVAWGDLAGRSVEDAEAVRILTDRIAAGLHAVTVNLDQWADRPLVECAVRIWEAEHRATPAAAERVARLERTTQLLGVVRQSQDPEGVQLARDVDRFRRRLERLRLRPGDLGAEVSDRRAVGWAVGKLYLAAPLALVVAVAGWAVFLVPYRATGWIVDRVRLKPDEKSTWKMLVGIGVYAGWVVLMALAAGTTGATGTTGGVWRGLVAGVAVLLGMPVIGMLGLVVRERWRGAWADARRFFRMRSRRDLVAQLVHERGALAARIDTLLTRLTTREPADSP